MPFNPKIQRIIQHNIFIERNIIDWNEYKNNIINNINNINFTEKIENYVPPPGRSLYFSRQRMRSLIYNTISINKKIFKEVGYEFYKPREQFNLTDSDVYNFIEECIKILVKKQQLK